MDPLDWRLRTVYLVRAPVSSGSFVGAAEDGLRVRLEDIAANAVDKCAGERRMASRHRPRRTASTITPAFRCRPPTGRLRVAIPPNHGPCWSVIGPHCLSLGCPPVRVPKWMCDSGEGEGCQQPSTGSQLPGEC